MNQQGEPEAPLEPTAGEDELLLSPADEFEHGVAYDQLPHLLDWPYTVEPDDSYQPYSRRWT